MRWYNAQTALSSSSNDRVRCVSELYLFATFVENGHSIVPIRLSRFSCHGLLGEFSVGQRRSTLPGMRLVPFFNRHNRHAGATAFLSAEYMPIKYGSALTSKLSSLLGTAKRWRQASGLCHPGFSRADVNAEDSLGPAHLFVRCGSRWHKEADGSLRITSRDERIDGAKDHPLGFFRLPGAENVSAVVFSNSGTISKFNQWAC